MIAGPVGVQKPSAAKNKTKKGTSTVTNLVWGRAGCDISVLCTVYLYCVLRTVTSKMSQDMMLQILAGVTKDLPRLA